MKAIYKKASVLVIISALFVFEAKAQKYSGDGNVTMQERTVSSFSKIEVNGVFNVHLSQGEKEIVKVEADENLQEIITTKVEDGKLKVKMKDGTNLKKSKKMNIYITLKDISDLEIEGVGNVKSDNQLKLKNLHLKFSGVGNVGLDLTADKLTAKTESVGNITLTGSITEVNLDNEGIGSLKAFDLKTDFLTLDCSGTGTTEVYADKEISITASGVGNVYYKGNAVVKKLNASGIGKVKKI